MPNWHELDYSEVSADWRHRDNLTWQIPSVIVVVGGALIAAAFGLDLDDEWSSMIRALLLIFGAVFSFILSIALAQNLWYQVGSQKALGSLEKFLQGKGKKAPRARGKMRRVISPRAISPWRTHFIKTIACRLTGSTLLLLLCLGITGSLFWLFCRVI